MKQLTKIILIFTIAFYSCIGDDFIDDRVDERISIDNPISEIQVNNTYQLSVTFFNNIGQPENTDITWSSSDLNIATVDNEGLLTAITQGEVTITISASTENGDTITEVITIIVTTEIVNNDDPVSKSGTIVTTSSYILEGDFTISEINDTQNLDLQIAQNYQASSSLPGLYLYLSNNPNSINGALEIGAVQVFNGAHSYEIDNVGINEYQYLLYWCKPFSVKVGHGEIND